jgi:MFS family permease
MNASIINKSVRRRISGSLFASQSLFSAATILLFTLTPVIAAELGDGDRVATWPSTVTLLMRAILAYPIGWALDRFGRRLGLSTGYLLGTIGALIAIWSIINGSFTAFMVAAAFIGGSRASSEQSRYVAAEVYPSRSRSKVIGWIVFAGTVGTVLGGPVLGEPSIALAESNGLIPFTGPFLVASFLLLVGAVITFILLRPDPQRIGREIEAAEKERADGELAADAPARPLREIYAPVLPKLAVSSMTIGQLVMAMLMVITSLHMLRSGYDSSLIWWVISAHTLGMFGLSGLTGWLIGRFGRLPMIAAGSVVLITACLLAPVAATVPVLALALFLLGLGWNFAFVSGSTLLSDHLVPAERGRAQGAGEMSVAIGAGIGTLSSGYLFGYGGINLVSLVGLLFAITLLGMTGLVTLTQRSAAQAVVNSGE